MRAACKLALTAIMLSCLVACSLEDEILSRARKDIENRLLHCGYSWYGTGGRSQFQGGVIEMKGLSIQLLPATLSNADRANGITWKGRVVVEAELYREYDSGWRDWQDGSYRTSGWTGEKQSVPLFLSGFTHFFETTPGVFPLTVRNGEFAWPDYVASASKPTVDCATIANGFLVKPANTVPTDEIDGWVGRWTGKLAGYSSTIEIFSGFGSTIEATVTYEGAAPEELTQLVVNAATLTAHRPADDAELSLERAVVNGATCLRGSYLEHGTSRPILLCR